MDEFRGKIEAILQDNMKLTEDLSEAMTRHSRDVITPKMDKNPSQPSNRPVSASRVSPSKPRRTNTTSLSPPTSPKKRIVIIDAAQGSSAGAREERLEVDASIGESPWSPKQDSALYNMKALRQKVGALTLANYTLEEETSSYKSLLEITMEEMMFFRNKCKEFDNALIISSESLAESLQYFQQRDSALRQQVAAAEQDASHWKSIYQESERRLEEQDRWKSMYEESEKRLEELGRMWMRESEAIKETFTTVVEERLSKISSNLKMFGKDMLLQACDWMQSPVTLSSEKFENVVERRLPLPLDQSSNEGQVALQRMLNTLQEDQSQAITEIIIELCEQISVVLTAFLERPESVTNSEPDQPGGRDTGNSDAFQRLSWAVERSVENLAMLLQMSPEDLALLVHGPSAALQGVPLLEAGTVDNVQDECRKLEVLLDRLETRWKEQNLLIVELEDSVVQMNENQGNMQRTLQQLLIEKRRFYQSQQ